jgi:hypothetical protein
MNTNIKIEMNDIEKPTKKIFTQVTRSVDPEDKEKGYVVSYSYDSDPSESATVEASKANAPPARRGRLGASRHGNHERLRNHEHHGNQHQNAGGRAGGRVGSVGGKGKGGEDFLLGGVPNTGSHQSHHVGRHGSSGGNPNYAGGHDSGGNYSGGDHGDGSGSQGGSYGGSYAGDYGGTQAGYPSSGYGGTYGGHGSGGVPPGPPPGYVNADYEGGIPSGPYGGMQGSTLIVNLI